MKTNLFDQKWKDLGPIELNKDIFGLEANDGLVHRALVYQLANARQVVAHTKTRGERRGSTRKLYRQKGTGRARMGSNRSPIRKKGWVAFGPRNTVNFTQSMNKKERRKALFVVLSSKLKEKNLIILDAIKLKEYKTKNMETILNAVAPAKKDERNTLLLALPEKNEMIQKSASNLPNVKTILASYLNIKDLLKYNRVILLKDSLEYLDGLAK